MVSTTHKKDLKKIYLDHFEGGEDDATIAFLNDVYKLVSTELSNDKNKVVAAPKKGKAKAPAAEAKEPKMYGKFCSITTELHKTPSEDECQVTITENWGKTASGKAIWQDRKEEFGLDVGQELSYVEMVSKVYNVIGGNNAARANGILWGLLSLEDRTLVTETFGSMAKKSGKKGKSPVVAQLYAAEPEVYNKIKVQLQDNFSDRAGAPSKSKASFEEESVKYKAAGIVYGKTWRVGDLMEKMKEIETTRFRAQAIWWGLLDEQTRTAVVAAYSGTEVAEEDDE